METGTIRLVLPVRAKKARQAEGEQPAAKASEDTLKPGARNWRILVIRHTADASARQPLVRTKGEAHNIMRHAACFTSLRGMAWRTSRTLSAISLTAAA